MVWGMLLEHVLGSLSRDSSLIQANDPTYWPSHWLSPDDPHWPKVVYGISILSVLSLVIFVFWEHGIKTSAPVCIYVGALSTMTISLRNVFAVQGFNFPLFTTSCHFLGTALFAGSVLLFKSKSGEVTVINKATFLIGVLPAAVCFALSLGLSNLGIAFTNAHFYEMVESTSFVCVACIAWIMGKAINALLWVPLCLAMLGMSMCWTGEAKFSLIGFIFLILASLLRSTKTMLNQLVMDKGNANMQTLQPLELTFYNALTCFGIMVPAALLFEGLAPFTRILDIGNFTAVMITVLNALAINLSSVIVIHQIGGVAQSLTGNMKGPLSVIGAWATLGEVITVRQVVGYVIVLMCITAYNKLDRRLQEQKKHETVPLCKDQGQGRV